MLKSAEDAVTALKAKVPPWGVGNSEGRKRERGMRKGSGIKVFQIFFQVQKFVDIPSIFVRSYSYPLENDASDTDCTDVSDFQSAMCGCQGD